MAYTRTYRTVVPLDPGADLDIARWLARESFELKAAGDCLHIVTYAESTVTAADLPPKAAKQLGRPLDYYQWYAFTATATAATSA